MALGIAAVVVIAVVVIAVLALPGLLGGGGGGSGTGIVYRNDDNELMYLADLKEKTQALELTDEAGYATSVLFSHNGKTVYFTDSDATLYSIAVSDLEAGGRPERISRNVNGFSVLSDGKLIYFQNDSGENKLSVVDGTDNYRLLRGYSDYQISSDLQSIYYTEQDTDDGTLTLYRIAIEKDAKGERLLKGASTIYSQYDADILVYGVVDSEDGGTTTLYSCVPGGEKTKLVSDVYYMTGLSISGGKVSFYYYLEDLDERTLYDFVTDSQAAADADILAQPEPEYPNWGDYEVYGIYIEDGAVRYYPGAVFYSDYNDNFYTLDLTQIIDADFLATTDISLEEICNYYYSELYDLAYADALARSTAAYDDYNARYDEWSAAQSREYMRQTLKDTAYSQSSLSLYRYADGSGELLASGISSTGNRAGSASNGIFLYHKVGESSGTVADVADLSYYGEVSDLLKSGTSTDDEWYQNVGGRESVIDLEDITYVTVCVLSEQEAVLRLYDGEEFSLCSYALGKDALTFSSTIYEGNDCSGLHWAEGGSALYFFTDTDEDSYGTIGDFCIYKNGKLETIAREVYGAVVLSESGSIYVASDIDSYGVELSVLEDGKTTVIHDEITDSEYCIAFLDSKQVLYVSDGDLYLWDGKENRRIATDVEEFWAGAEESYDIYYTT